MSSFASARTASTMSNNIVTSVSFKFSDQALKTMERRIMEGMFEMGIDMAAQARRNAPVLTSALRNSIRVEEDGNVVYVKAGGNVHGHQIDYALKREYENNAHPWTRYYMKRAQESIMTGDYMTKYFKGVTK